MAELNEMLSAPKADESSEPRLDGPGPSQMMEDELAMPRMVGIASVMALIIGFVAVGFGLQDRSFAIGPGLGLLFMIAGLTGLVVHAFMEEDATLRLAFFGAGVLGALAGTGVLFLSDWSVAGRALGAIIAFVALPLLLSVARGSSAQQPVLGFVPRGLLIAGIALLTIGLAWLFRLSERGEFENIGLPLVLSALGGAYFLGVLGFLGWESELGNRSGWLATLGGLAIALLALLRSLAHEAGWWPALGSAYFVPGGYLIVLVSLLLAGASYATVSDRPTLVVARRELEAFFYSPIAYFVLISFALATWFSYQNFLGNLAEGRVLEPILNYYVIELFLIICLLFSVPLITMRLLSEEMRAGTLEVLLTAPVDETAVVLGKFLAAFVMFMSLWLPFALYLLSLPVAAQPGFDFRPLLSFAVVLSATGAGFVAMGLLFSAVSSNQLVAGALTLVGMIGLLVPYILQFRLMETSGWGTVLNHISFLSGWESALEGKLIPRQLVFSLSLTVFCLFCAGKALESRKWK